MGRRRSRKGSDGFVDVLVERCFSDVRVGVFISSALLLAGAVSRWVPLTAHRWHSELVGQVLMWIGGIFGFVTLIGWVVTTLRRGERVGRLDATRSAKDLRAMDWREFEQLVADLYRRRGYHVRETGGSTADGGVDLVLEKDGVEQLVQCKQYRTWSVGEPKVREFYGAMAARISRGEGLFVTCGTFTEPARRFAEGKPIRLIDGDALLALLNETNPVTPPAERSPAGPAPAPSGRVVTDVSPPVTGASSGVPSCPACGGTMIRRRATRGQGAGQEFWGCSTFPACRKTLPLDAVHR